MNRGSRVRFGLWYIIACALLLVGVVAFCIGMNGLDWNFKSLDTTTYTERSFVPAESESIAGLDINMRSREVVVVGTEGNFGVEYNDWDDNKLEVSIENNILIIKEARKFQPFNLNVFKDINYKKQIVHVSVPKVLIEESKILVSSGFITLEDVEFEKHLVVSAASGEIKIKNAIAQSASIDAKSGLIFIENVVLSKPSIIKTSSGSINLKSVIAQKIDLTANSGIVEIVNSSIDDFVVDLKSGSFNGNQLNCINLAIFGKSGMVDIDKLIVICADISVASGSINAQIIGNKTDYTITAEVKSGSKNISNQTGATQTHKLNFYATSGIIEVQFA